MIDPRGVLRELGLELAAGRRGARVGQHRRSCGTWCVPERPAGTETLSEEQLAVLVTRDAMIGVAKVVRTGRSEEMNGIHDMGGMHGMGPIERETDEPVFHARWESRVFALNRAVGAWGKWNHRRITSR